MGKFALPLSAWTEQKSGRTGYFSWKARAIWSRRGLVRYDIGPRSPVTVEIKAAPQDIDQVTLGRRSGTASRRAYAGLLVLGNAAHHAHLEFCL